MKMKDITFVFAFLLGGYVGRQTELPVLGWWLVVFSPLLGYLNVSRLLLYNLVYRARQRTIPLSTYLIAIVGSSVFHAVAILLATAVARSLVI